MAPLMIYGATGYTGRLICNQARRKGLDITIAGRSEHKLRDLANSLNASYRVFDLSVTLLDTHLKGIAVLLNCAGPFARTARTLMKACSRLGVHYLDVSAEIESYLLASELSEVAAKADVMLLPGCGGSVAMLGCLAAYAMQRIASPVSIDVGLHVAGSMSRGSAVSAVEGAGAGCLQLRDGELVRQDPTEAVFDFADGRGPVSCFPATLPDLITLQHSTKSSNVRTFVNISGNTFPADDIASLSDGPSVEERAASPYHAAVVARDVDGVEHRAVLHAVNGYTFTAVASVEAARRTLTGEVKTGWQTPAGLFGDDFLDTVPDTAIIQG